MLTADSTPSGRWLLRPVVRSLVVEAPGLGVPQDRDVVEGDPLAFRQQYRVAAHEAAGLVDGLLRRGAVGDHDDDVARSAVFRSEQPGSLYGHPVPLEVVVDRGGRDVAVKEDALAPRDVALEERDD